MNIFKNDEKGYLAWHADHPNAFVFNNFGGTNAAYNILHRSNCVFLWRDIDDESRTMVEKWCSAAEQELAEHADVVLGNRVWKKCGVCFREPKVDLPAQTRPQALGDNQTQTDRTLWIPGEPAVWLGSGEKEWKQQVTAVLKESMPHQSPEWIDCELRLTRERVFKKDIDNMLTPLLESARDAGWVERGFARLGSVTARKTVVADADRAGAIIMEQSKPPNITDHRIGVLVETDLARLDADSVKWALYARAFELFQHRPELRYPPSCPLALDIRVTVDDEQRRKSIQALMKPCIDGVEPILGHPDNLLPEPREQLNRRLAPQDEMILSLAFHVRGGASNTVSVLISPYQNDSPLE